MLNFSDAVALIVLGLTYQEAAKAKIREAELAENDREHEILHGLIVKSGKLTPEIEHAHQQMLNSLAREAFRGWFSSNSFLYGLGGAFISYLCGITPWPGLCLGVSISSPRMWGYAIRWRRILIFCLLAIFILIIHLLGGWNWLLK